MSSQLDGSDLAGQDNPYKYDEILPTCLRGSESVWHLLRNSFIGLWILPPAGIFPQLGFSQKESGTASRNKILSASVVHW